MTDRESSRTVICPRCGARLQASPDHIPAFCIHCGGRLTARPGSGEESGPLYPDTFADEESDNDVWGDTGMQEVYGPPRALPVYAAPPMRYVYGPPEMRREDGPPRALPVYGAPGFGRRRKSILARFIDWITGR